MQTGWQDTLPDPCMMEDKPEVRANSGFLGSKSLQIPVLSSRTSTAHYSAETLTLARRPSHAWGDWWGGDDQMHSHPSSSTQPSPQAGDLGFAGRCSRNSLNHSSNYISAFASGRRDVGPCTSPRHR